MNDFSYHHRSLEVHLIIIFNASHHFVFQMTPYSNKDKSRRHEDPNNHVWDTQSLLEKVKRLLFVVGTRFLKFLRIIHIWRAINGLTLFCFSQVLFSEQMNKF
jgi:hypothetical protein